MEHDKLTIPPLHLGSAPWAIRPEMLPRLIEANRLPNLPAWEAAMVRHLAAGADGPRALRRGASRMSGSVAVIPISGVLTPRGSFLSMLFGGGGGGLRSFREEFAEAVDSPEIGAIVLDVNSPGGLVEMVMETGQVIRDARGEKPIIAVADTLAASGAYWLAAQADEVVVTPSGRVGSIGVYMVHEDWSGWNAQMGVDPTYISAGRYKTEANPDEALSDDAKADWQNEVDTLYQRFLSQVATGRGVSVETVSAEYGEGRCYLADAALAAGMVDRIEPLDSVIAELLGGRSSSAAKSAARINAAARGARAEDAAAPDDEPEDQPHCETCGRWISSGASQCEECKAKDEDDDEDPDDDDENDDVLPDDDDDEEEPKASDEDRAAEATLLFGS